LGKPFPTKKAELPSESWTMTGLLILLPASKTEFTVLALEQLIAGIA